MNVPLFVPDEKTLFKPDLVLETNISRASALKSLGFEKEIELYFLLFGFELLLSKKIIIKIKLFFKQVQLKRNILLAFMV